MINDDMSMAEKVALSGMLGNLAQIGVIAPESDRDWVRETLGLPDVKEGAVIPQWSLEKGNEQEQNAQDNQSGIL